jgi:hypothetical protein
VEGIERAAEHLPVDADQASAPMNLLDLGIEQAGQGAPDWFGLTEVLNPLTEVGGERVEIQFQAITTEDGQVRRRQGLAHLMDEVMGKGLRAWAEEEGWDELGGGVQGDPQPEIVRGLTGVGEEFVELDVSESQAVAEVLMQGLSVKSGAG